MIEKLIDYIEGRLSPKAAAEVATLIETNAEARETLAWLNQFESWREQVQLPAPNPAVIENLVAAHARKFAGERAPSLVQRITAKLSVDSWGLQGMAAGARSADLATHSRQLAFTTEPLDIILDVVAGAVNGQVLPNQDGLSESFVVQLIQDDESAAVTHSDSFGEFRFFVDSGDYQLVLSNETLEVWLPTLHIA